jgi:hypothetical protein
MAHKYFAEYAVFCDGVHGVTPVPQITVDDGSDTSNYAAIIRFCMDRRDGWLTGTAGETFADVDQQFLCYRNETDGRLYKAHTWFHLHDQNPSQDHLSRNLWIVDQERQGAQVTAGNALSYVKPYMPLGYKTIEFDMVSGIDDIYVKLLSQPVVQPTVGTIVSNDGKMWVPTTLWSSATLSDVATPTTTLATCDTTATAAYAVIDTTTIGEGDLTDYAGSGTASYALVVVDTLNTKAIMAFIGAVTDGGGDAYTLNLYNSAALTVQSVLGNATDIAGAFTTNATGWYIVPVDNLSDGEYAYESDDATAGVLIDWSSDLTGMLRLNSTMAGATTLFYSDNDYVRLPDTNSGMTWLAGNVFAVDNSPNTMGSTILLAAKSSASGAVIGGHIVR